MVAIFHVFFIIFIFDDLREPFILNGIDTGTSNEDK